MDSVNESIGLIGWLLDNWGSLDLMSQILLATLALYPVLNWLVELTPTDVDNRVLAFLVNKIARPLTQSTRNTLAAKHLKPESFLPNESGKRHG